MTTDGSHPHRYLVELKGDYRFYEWWRSRHITSSELIKQFQNGQAPVMDELAVISEEDRRAILASDYPEKYKLGDDGFPTREYLIALEKAREYRYKHFMGKFTLGSGTSLFEVHGFGMNPIYYTSEAWE